MAAADVIGDRCNAGILDEERGGDYRSEVKPVVLENDGERDFVLDLQAFCEAKKVSIKDKELYLLRKMS